MRAAWRRWGIALVLGLVGVPAWAGDTAGGVPATATPPAATSGTAPAAPATRKPTGAEYLADGEKQFKARNYSAALSSFVMAWLEMPDNPEVLERIGTVFAQTGRLAESTRFFALAIKLNPGYEKAIISLADVYLRVKLPEQAIILLEDPSRQARFSKSPNYLHMLALVFQAQGRFDKSVGVLKSALALAVMKPPCL